MFGPVFSKVAELNAMSSSVFTDVAIELDGTGLLHHYYFKHTSDEHTIIMVSVDDMAVTLKHPQHIILFKDELQKHFEILDLGALTWLLGLKVECD